MDNKIIEAFDELAEFVKKVLAARIEEYGYNPRARKNTLKGSNLERSIHIATTTESLSLTIADYWEHISLGWERTHRYEGTYSQFVANIMSWIREKGITVKGKNQNQIAFGFFKFFVENGIKARPFMVYDKDGDLENMIPQLKEYMEEWVNTLFEKMIFDIDNYFNK